MNEKALFEDFLSKYRKSKTMLFCFDIETLTYNKEAGRKKPTDYKSITYAIIVNYFLDDRIGKILLPNFKSFFKLINNSKLSKTCKIKLIAHNSNKFDNHFLLHDLKKLDDFKLENIYLSQSLDKSNQVQPKNVSKKENTIFTKRVKSKNNLELLFYYDNREYQTIDNFLKTHTSIKVLGEKLQRLGILSPDDLKTDFNYTKFDKDENMTYEEAFEYAEKVFESLSDDEKRYIYNDGTILSNTVKHYEKLYPSFDYKQITMTRNVLNYYLDDREKTSYQLLKKLPEEQIHVKYTDYQFNDENFYDYSKKYYNGGCNFYNDKFIGKIIKNMFSMDINSSYPFVMFDKKIPTFLIKAETNKKIKKPEFNENFFNFYEINKKWFNFHILRRIKSKQFKKILVKYYANLHDNVYVNDLTFKLIEEIAKIKITELEVVSFVRYACEDFESKDLIFELYKIKTQGKQKHIINMETPFDYEITKELNDNPFSDEEIDLAKVKLNALYGIPALKSHFNLFETIDNNFYNHVNGYKNNERNIVFASFVTAYAFYNLLSPLSCLTSDELDECLIYTDTDSLYLSEKVKQKVLKNTKIDKVSLGAWDIENDKIDKFFVNNHKKYCYFTNNKLKIKSGGISEKSFTKEEKEKPFEDFVKDNFSNNSSVKNLRSIMNSEGTITLYESLLTLELGSKYPETFSTLRNRVIIEELEEMKKQIDDIDDDILYIESNLGAFSQAEINPVKCDHENKKPIKELITLERVISKK